MRVFIIVTAMDNSSDKQHQLDARYLRMAMIWAENSYCRRRQVGAIIVKEKIMMKKIIILMIEFILEQMQNKK
mgnify:CR=1 FL=1